MDHTFNNLPAEQRLEAIQATAIRKELMPVRHVFTEEEKTQQKNLLSEMSITLASIEEEKKKAMAAIAEKLKPLLRSRNEMICWLRNGFVDIDKDVYLIDDQSSNTMNYIDETGNIVYSRPLLPQEKQTRMIGHQIAE